MLQTLLLFRTQNCPVHLNRSLPSTSKLTPVSLSTRALGLSSTTFLRLSNFNNTLYRRISGQARGSNMSEAGANAQDQRNWNRMADTMRYFHEHFKMEFNEIYKLADGSFSKRGMSLGLYLKQANELKRHLTAHHTIEEQHVFPILAKRMPTFRTDEAHIKSHHAIHEGLDRLGELIGKWKVSPSTYSPDEMRVCLDSWREVLFKHLDEEIEDLSGENMKKYWTLEEMATLPM